MHVSLLQLFCWSLFMVSEPSSCFLLFFMISNFRSCFLSSLLVLYFSFLAECLFSSFLCMILFQVTISCVLVLYLRAFLIGNTNTNTVPVSLFLNLYLYNYFLGNRITNEDPDLVSEFWYCSHGNSNMNKDAASRK